MKDTKDPSLILSSSDERLLRALVASGSSPAQADLEEEIDRALVVADEELPEGTVSLHTQVELRDMHSGQASSVTVVLPHEADSSRNRVSILAPMGIALIGLREGQCYEWPMPGGRRKAFRVESVRRAS